MNSEGQPPHQLLLYMSTRLYLVRKGYVCCRHDNMKCCKATRTTKKRYPQLWDFHDFPVKRPAPRKSDTPQVIWEPHLQMHCKKQSSMRSHCKCIAQNNQVMIFLRFSCKTTRTTKKRPPQVIRVTIFIKVCTTEYQFVLRSVGLYYRVAICTTEY